MSDAMVFTERSEFWILKFFVMVTSNFNNFNAFKLLYRFVEFDENLESFIFYVKKVYLSVPWVVVYNDIPVVLFTKASCENRTKQIHM